MLSFLPPLIQAHWEPNTEHSDSYLPGAHVHQEAGWTESGLRTRLQIFNHRSLSSLSPPPSSARYQLSPVLTQLIPLPTLFSSWNKIISESHSLLVISIMQLSFCWFLPQSSPTSLTPPQDHSLLISLQPFRVSISLTPTHPPALAPVAPLQLSTRSPGGLCLDTLSTDPTHPSGPSQILTLLKPAQHIPSWHCPPYFWIPWGILSHTEGRHLIICALLLSQLQLRPSLAQSTHRGFR